MPCSRSSAAGPTPESFSSFGELIEPALTITSRRARDGAHGVALAILHADGATLPSNRMRVASACVRTARFGRFIAGRR